MRLLAKMGEMCNIRWRTNIPSKMRFLGFHLFIFPAKGLVGRRLYKVALVLLHVIVVAIHNNPEVYVDH